jgi:serine protease AprX
MGPKMSARHRSYAWLAPVIALALAMLLTPLLSSTAPAQVTLRAQPLLLQMASVQPESRVDVIVQKWTQDDHIERLVVRLGGEVVSDLRLINAFVATVPAGAMPELAAASGVRWVSLDAPVVRTDCPNCVETSALASAAMVTIGADRLWNQTPRVRGQGVTVAVVDSGINKIAEFAEDRGPSRVIASFSYRAVCSDNRCAGDKTVDWYGHGSAMADFVGGDGSMSDGKYPGVAPEVNLLNVKVCDQNGVGRTSDIVEGLQWIYDHKAQYNIRVVNLSLNSNVPESYRTSPLDAALEILWLNRIVVVVSAGNNGANGVLYPPANDPFVLTVGAMDDRGTNRTSDDILASFSARGTTEAGFAKPDLVAPGVNLNSAAAAVSTLALLHPDRIVGTPPTLRMSGTSAASAVTAGAAALLVQSNPRLTPDQVKFRLKATARPMTVSGAGAGVLNIYAAVHSATTQSANTGLAISPLVRTGRNPVMWNSLNWDSLNWDSLNWDSVNWNSLNWDSLNWDSDYWGK